MTCIYILCRMMAIEPARKENTSTYVVMHVEKSGVTTSQLFSAPPQLSEIFQCTVTVVVLSQIHQKEAA